MVLILPHIDSDSPSPAWPCTDIRETMLPGSTIPILLHESTIVSAEAELEMLLACIQCWGRVHYSGQGFAFAPVGPVTPLHEVL